MLPERVLAERYQMICDPLNIYLVACSLGRKMVSMKLVALLMDQHHRVGCIVVELIDWMTLVIEGLLDCQWFWQRCFEFLKNWNWEDKNVLSTIWNLRPKKIIFFKMLKLYSSARFQWIAWTLFEDEDAEVVEVVKVGSGCDRGVIGGWIVLQSPSMVKRPTRSSLSIIFWWWSSSTSPTTRRCWSSSPAYTYRWWMATWRRSPPTPGPDHQWWIQPLWL